MAEQTISQKLREKALHYDAGIVSNAVLDDPRFALWSGSSRKHQHHYGMGGLAEHTLEVVRLCEVNNGFFSEQRGVDPKLLFLAALFHDCGKMWDYEPVHRHQTHIDGRPKSLLDDNGYEVITPSVEWAGTTHKRRIHHISRSALVWNEAAGKNGFKQSDIDEVTHAILAHHGQREWGSPVCPSTKLAFLLHYCDGISARMDDCEKFDRLM